MRALFKGLSTPLVTLAGLNAILFGTYSWCVKTLQPGGERVNMRTSVISSIITAVVQIPLTTTIELVKLRMQTQGIGTKYYSRFSSKIQLGSNLMGPLNTVHNIIHTEGPSKLFRGIVVTFYRDCIGYVAYFTVYEYLCQYFAGHESLGTLRTDQLAVAGGIAGITTWTSCFPLDVVKSRIQVDGVQGPRQYNGMIDCFKKSYYADGWRVFFRGLGTTLVRAFPVNAATFSVVTLLLQYFGNEEAVL